VMLTVTVPRLVATAFGRICMGAALAPPAATAAAMATAPMTMERVRRDINPPKRLRGA